jgi:hypothetical protein
MELFDASNVCSALRKRKTFGKCLASPSLIILLMLPPASFRRIQICAAAGRPSRSTEGALAATPRAALRGLSFTAWRRLPRHNRGRTAVRALAFVSFDTLLRLAVKNGRQEVVSRRLISPCLTTVMDRHQPGYYAATPRPDHLYSADMAGPGGEHDYEARKKVGRASFDVSGSLTAH